MGCARFDLVVVGATSDAVLAAEVADQRGLSTALVDPFPQEATCDRRWIALQNRLVGLQTALGGPASGFANRQEVARTIWAEEVARSPSAESGVDASTSVRSLRSPGRFVSAHRFELQSGETIEADAFLLATGTHPRRPDRFRSQMPPVCDRQSILDDRSSPRSVLILGADWIGCEWAFVLASMGAEVILVDRRTRLLRALDADLRCAVQSSLHDMGVVVALGEELEGVDIEEGGPCWIRLSSGRSEVVERLLVLAGEMGNTQGLGLERAGVCLGPQGHIVIDEHFRSSVPKILAIGSVADPIGLAPSGEFQAYSAINALRGSPSEIWMGTPWILRSSLEVAMCGLTEEVCEKLDVSLYTGYAESNAHPSHRRIAKVLVSREDEARILGVHLLGEGAAEAIHLAADAVQQRLDPEAAQQVACAPGTMVELYWRALRSAQDQRRTMETAAEKLSAPSECESPFGTLSNRRLQRCR